MKYFHGVAYSKTYEVCCGNLYAKYFNRVVVMKKKRSGFMTPQWGAAVRTQKLKSYLVRTQSLNVLSLKPGVGQYIAIHATLTAKDFFLAYFYTSGPFTCIFSKISPNFSGVGCG